MATGHELPLLSFLIVLDVFHAHNTSAQVVVLLLIIINIFIVIHHRREAPE
ncbi:hypothetical protein Syun_011451 [Stephania yunnanensis]|uniref:Uncharacterized protein n=1 Tax=Stephania yunnanensis TaxID=152371 RepID=A0AAP0JXT7_9MAGN